MNLRALGIQGANTVEILGRAGAVWHGDGSNAARGSKPRRQNGMEWNGTDAAIRQWNWASGIVLRDGIGKLENPDGLAMKAGGREATVIREANQSKAKLKARSHLAFAKNVN